MTVLAFLSLFCLLLALGFAFLWSREWRARQSLQSEYRILEEREKSSNQLFEQMKSGFEDRFKSLANDTLAQQSQQFLQLARGEFEKENQNASNELEAKKIAINQLIQPLNEKLDLYQSKISEIEKDRHQSYSRVEEELKRVIQSNQTLSQETNALKGALTKPNVRGRWGELQLKNCIELAGMSEFADVTFQDIQTTDDGKTMIPDMTVRMPGERIVVVDAKTPIEAFLASLESQNEIDRQSEILKHGRHVKEHIKALSSRGYAEDLVNSADFIIMFLPNESFLYAALETQPDLVEFGLERKILIATPPTLIGLLKVIRLGWSEEKLAQNAQQISEVGKELHKRVVDFTEAFVGIGRQLHKAQDEYEVGLTRLKSRVLVQAKRLEKLGAKSKKNFDKKVEPDEDDVDVAIEGAEPAPQLDA